MTDFTTMIPSARAFYTALAANNEKAWWDENRGTYDDVLKPAALRLLDQMKTPLAQIADCPVKTKLFRPHRDVRFSKDKTPYKTHMHMMWTLDCDARQAPVFFFGIGLDYVTVGAGLMGFDKPVLEDWRKFADLDADRLNGILADVAAKGFVPREPELKRVPNAYDKDHPGGELLRRKGLVVTGSLDDSVDDLPGALTSAFTDLWPINALILQVAEN